MDIKNVRKWRREFKNGRTDIHDEQRVRRSSVSDETIAKVERVMLEDRRVTIRELCELIPDVSKITIGIDRTFACRMLTEDHKRQYVEAAREFVDCYAEEGEEFFDSIVTDDNETKDKRTVPSVAAFRIAEAAKL